MTRFLIRALAASFLFFPNFCGRLTMPSLFSISSVSGIFPHATETEETRKVIEKTARECLTKLASRLNAEWLRWSPFQLRGYLRAISTPWTDRVAKRISARMPQKGDTIDLVKNHFLDTLEHLVCEELNKPATIPIRGTEAA
jgi:hypothetical protein